MEKPNDYIDWKHKHNTNRIIIITDGIPLFVLTGYEKIQCDKNTLRITARKTYIHFEKLNEEEVQKWAEEHDTSDKPDCDKVTSVYNCSNNTTQ